MEAPETEKAAVAIQSQFRKFQKKKTDDKQWWTADCSVRMATAVWHGLMSHVIESILHGLKVATCQSVIPYVQFHKITNYFTAVAVEQINRFVFYFVSRFILYYSQVYLLMHECLSYFYLKDLKCKAGVSISGLPFPVKAQYVFSLSSRQSLTLQSKYCELQTWTWISVSAK